MSRCFVFIIAMLLQGIGICAAQSMPTVTLPTISAPSMPTVTADSTAEKTKSVKTAHNANMNDALSAVTLGLLGNKGTDTALLNNLLSGASGSTVPNTAGNNYTNTLLTQLIEQLAKQNESNAQKEVSLQNNKQTELPSKTVSKILRFSVNGYNILQTCNTVYFSESAKDGSFLLTADRRYYSDNILRTETFYLLFKKESDSAYSVAVDVLQDYTNEYSFVYQLAQRSPVAAQKTGNMVVIKINDPAWKLDILLDVQ